jgi:hypothetical protein
MRIMSITRLTKEYINSHPSVKDCMRHGIINYSKLSRMIMKEKGVSEFDAVLIACRRHSSSIKKDKTSESAIINVMKASSIEVRNRRMAAVIEKSTSGDTIARLQQKIMRKKEPFHLIEGTNAITIITSMGFMEDITASCKGRITSIGDGLAELLIKSPRRIETTAGVNAHIFSLLADNNINVIEQMSCWTDTLIIIKEEDIGKAMEALKF